MIAEAEAKDQGKTFKRALSMEIPRAVKNLRYFAGALLGHDGQSSAMEGFQSFTLTCPIGIVGLISPWNLPLYLLTWKLAPALASIIIILYTVFICIVGNCVIAKPSELTSLTAHMLCQLITEAGFPKGVVNVVLGLGSKAGEAIVRHPDIRAVSFTGGTATGRRIQEIASLTNKKISLELGGKNANIIFADCDKEKGIATTVHSSFANQGEICLCGSRILVQRPFYEEFLERFTAEVEKLEVGDPFDGKSFIGALVSAQHLAKVRSYIDLATNEGCKIMSGGSTPANLPESHTGGYFLRPTVIANVSLDSPLMKEEIFGPVVCVVPFDTTEEAIAVANATEYGLSASVWTEDMKKAQHVAASVDVGTVWINCWMIRDLAMPFGGVKSSGIGREGGKHSLDFFSEVKTVTMAL